MLQEEDYHARLDFCQQFKSKIHNSPGFLDELTFSDETTFHISGKVNRHNCRIWGTEKPQEVWQHERDSPKINVWCALRKSRIIGPFFFEEATVNGEHYLAMLQNFFIPELRRLNLSDSTFFQQDGAPCHYASNVRQLLNAVFPDKWIGRHGPIAWPPRLLDLSPLDYFLWGYVKTVVYSSKLQSLDELRARITNAIHKITQQQLENVFNELENRIERCITKRGGYVEA
nr:PREDICTED: uncharacterized protein LOC102358965 [Latimeria chalumnae]XP_005998404.1 PREDICTED: uncharacterized protein LOC102358965 [Latimeria chalumnae]|eukprot:XP_005998403.1 PREDICTED: uncharacterized protein LOC102358965 [Latimeria chalumnae]